MRHQHIDYILQFTNEKDAFALLEEKIKTLPKKEIMDIFIQTGVMPELFNHDSSEEKMWSKYSDILLARSLEFLDMKALVLGARGNSADVFAETKDFTLVADAKTFRLSRTAKNQKDFKVSALDSWRRDHNYSMLVSPLFQYPKRKSQIYSQAISKNVTLYSYTHLKFLVENSPKAKLEEILNTGNLLDKELSKNEKSLAKNYWREIDRVTVDVSGKTFDDLQEYKNNAADVFKELAHDGIKYWQNKIEEYKKLSKGEAINLLIKAKKIDNKIIAINKSIDGLKFYLENA